MAEKLGRRLRGDVENWDDEEIAQYFALWEMQAEHAEREHQEWLDSQPKP